MKTTLPSRKSTGLPILGGLNAVFGFILALASFGAKYPSEAAVLMFMAAGSLIMGIGLIKGKRWARTFALIGYTLNVLVSILATNLIGAFVAGLIMVYLNTDKVKTIFGREPVLHAAPEGAAVVPLAMHIQPTA